MLDEVEKFNDLVEARVVVSYLEANGIKAVLADAHSSLLGIGGYPSAWHRVLAPREQVDRARRLLRDINHAPNADDGAYS